MSEPNQPQLQQIVEIFLEEFNKQNKTSYCWVKDKSYLAKSHDRKWADAVVLDKNNKELEIQHKEIIWDVFYDKVRSGAAEKVVKKLIETLKLWGLTSYSVHLNFYQKKLPTTDNDIDDFCYWVAEFIQAKSHDGYPKSYHLFLLPKTLKGFWIRLISTIRVFTRGVHDAYYIAIDKPEKVTQRIYSYDNGDDMFLNEIKRVTSYITVTKNPFQRNPIVGWGYSEPEPRPLPHFGDVVVSEIKRKIINKYDNLIVLLDCNRPIDEYDRNLILDQVKPMIFSGQIWLVENFVNKKAATCIYPIK